MGVYAVTLKAMLRRTHGFEYGTTSVVHKSKCNQFGIWGNFSGMCIVELHARENLLHLLSA